MPDRCSTKTLFWFPLCIIATLIFLLTGCQVQAVPPGEAVTVMRVVSGQTLEVLKPGSALAERVRLIGLVTPDLNQQPWSDAARAQLQAWIAKDPTVLLEADRQSYSAFTDKKGVEHQQRLAYVWQRGQMLNENMLAAGYALAKSHSPNTKYEQRLSNAQEKARLLEVGIWNPQNPLREAPKSNSTRTTP